MKTWLKIVLVLAGVGALLAYFVISSGQRRARMTEQASATVTGIEFDQDDESSSLDETDIRYSFTVGGREIRSETSRPGDRTKDFVPGTAVKVCYNPAEPAESDIADSPQSRCG